MEQKALWADQPSSRQLLGNVEALLKRRLPETWRTLLTTEPISGEEPMRIARADALLDLIAPDQSVARFILEVKASIDPRDVDMVVRQIASYRASDTAVSNGMVMAPFLSPITRELLEKTGTSYLDATGNAYVRADRPALYIRDIGAQSNPWRDPQAPLRSLKGPAAGRAIRALCDFLPPMGVRVLASRANVSAASISRVAGLLERAALLSADPRGRIIQVRWDQLIERWTQDYALSTANRTGTFLEPRGFGELLTKLRGTRLQYAVTGSLASARVVQIASSRLAVVFVPDREKAAKEWGLRNVDKGANVLLAEPFDPVVFDRTTTDDGVRYAALSQVAADLLTSPGRGPEEGEALMRWMREHELEWRRPL